jgi:hypothetical protein
MFADQRIGVNDSNIYSIGGDQNNPLNITNIFYAVDHTGKLLVLRSWYSLLDNDSDYPLSRRNESSITLLAAIFDANRFKCRTTDYCCVAIPSQPPGHSKAVSSRTRNWYRTMATGIWGIYTLARCSVCNFVVSRRS